MTLTIELPEGTLAALKADAGAQGRPLAEFSNEFAARFEARYGAA